MTETFADAALSETPVLGVPAQEAWAVPAQEDRAIRPDGQTLRAYAGLVGRNMAGVGYGENPAMTPLRDVMVESAPPKPRKVVAEDAMDALRDFVNAVQGALNTWDEASFDGSSALVAKRQLRDACGMIGPVLEKFTTKADDHV